MGIGWSSILVISRVEGRVSVTSTTERTAVVSVAVGEERRQGLLEGDPLLPGALDVPGARVGGSVEHRCAYGRGEERGPHHAQLAAVAAAVVGDLRLAERPSDGVHVTGRVVRPEIGHERAVLLCAVGGELLGQVDQLLTSRRGVRGDVSALVEMVVVGDAVNRRAGLAGPAWVPGDDVEMIDEGLAEVVRLQCVRRAGKAGTAAIDEQAADALGGIGEMTGDVQLQRAPGRIGVVDRHGEVPDLRAAVGAVNLVRSDSHPRARRGHPTERARIRRDRGTRRGLGRPCCHGGTRGRPGRPRGRRRLLGPGSRTCATARHQKATGNRHSDHPQHQATVPAIHDSADLPSSTPEVRNAAGATETPSRVLKNAVSSGIRGTKHLVDRSVSSAKCRISAPC